jgi:nucleotide-binding universal stress UspA family protein
MHPARLLLVAPDAPAQPTPPTVPGSTAGRPSTPAAVAGAAAPPRVEPLPPRRERPSLLVAVDDDPSSQAALVWTLREAARREATVVAVSVSPGPAVDDDSAGGRPGAPDGARLAELTDRVRAATAEAGVRPPVRTAVLDAAVYEALAGAARGGDLVVVGRHGKTLLRPAVARTHPVRRIAHPA